MEFKEYIEVYEQSCLEYGIWFEISQTSPTVHQSLSPVMAIFGENVIFKQSGYYALVRNVANSDYFDKHQMLNAIAYMRRIYDI